jgi:mono/diheme cytochrome c family protein
MAARGVATGRADLRLQNLLPVAATLLALHAGSAVPQESAPFSTARVAAGAALYETYCARCHGVDMVEPGDGFFDLRTFPPEQQSRFMNSVSNGKNSMPPWRAVLSPEDIANLFAYVVSGGSTD